VTTSAVIEDDGRGRGAASARSSRRCRWKGIVGRVNGGVMGDHKATSTAVPEMEVSRLWNLR
jgi:hypothetical protein